MRPEVLNFATLPRDAELFANAAAGSEFAKSVAEII
jgi:hypothetical protein